MHKYNDIVTLVRGKVETPALVVQSVSQADGEHLTLVSLDPDKASPLLSGMNVDAAIRRDFVTPLTEGKTYGWREAIFPDSVDPSAADITGEQGAVKVPPALTDDEVYEAVQADFIAHQQIIPPVGSTPEQVFKAAGRVAMTTVKTLQDVGDENTLLHAKLAEIERAAEAATKPMDEAQGEVEPGDPDSPHAFALSDVNSNAIDAALKVMNETQEAAQEASADPMTDSMPGSTAGPSKESHSSSTESTTGDTTLAESQS